MMRVKVTYFDIYNNMTIAARIINIYSWDSIISDIYSLGIILTNVIKMERIMEASEENTIQD